MYVFATDRHLNRLPAPPRITDLALSVVLIDKVLHDAATFENVYIIPIRVSVRQSRDSAVWIYRCEPGGFLLVGGHVYLVHFIGQSKFGEGDADFDAVRSLRCVEG